MKSANIAMNAVTCFILLKSLTAHTPQLHIKRVFDLVLETEVDDAFLSVKSKPVDLEFQIGSVLHCFGGFFTRFVTSFNVGRSSVMVSVFLETDTIWGGCSCSV